MDECPNCGMCNGECDNCEICDTSPREPEEKVDLFEEGFKIVEQDKNIHTNINDVQP